MKMTKDECLECGGISTLRDSDGTIKCLECGHHAVTSRSPRQRQSTTTAITVSRYHKADGYPTRYYAIHMDGILLAVTVYRKGAETLRETLMEMLAH